MKKIDKLTEIAKRHATEIIEEVNDEEGIDLYIVSKLLSAYIVCSSLWWEGDRE